MQFPILILTMMATSIAAISVRVSEVNHENYRYNITLRELWETFMEWPGKIEVTDVPIVSYSSSCPTGMMFSSLSNSCVEARKLCPEDFEPDHDLKKCVYVGVSTTESISVRQPQ